MRRCDGDDDGNGVMGDDNDMATGDNGSCCACLFGLLCRGRAADASAHAARLPAAAAFAGGGGRGGAVAHAALISHGVGPLTRRLALRDGATTTTMAMA